jgi:hypothetical protein
MQARHPNENPAIKKMKKMLEDKKYNLIMLEKLLKKDLGVIKEEIQKLKTSMWDERKEIYGNNVFVKKH